MGRYIFLLALLVCSATSFAQPALADTSKLYFHDGKFSWHASLSTLTTFLASSATMTEAAQDAVGTILSDGATIDLTYKDAVPEITAEVKPTSITDAHLAAGAVTMAKIAQSGATTGQVIKWNGSAWAPGTDNTGGGGGGDVATDLIWDAKGDLAVGTGADAAARLAVGTDGMQVFADASTSTGLRWGQNAITPAQITSDQNDYAPTGWAKCQIATISGDASFRAITGFAATFAGDRKTLINGDVNPIYYPGEHPNSTATNRLKLLADYIHLPGKAIDMMYDGSRWFIITPQADVKEWRTTYFYHSAGSVTTGDHPYLNIATSGTGAGVAAIAATTALPSSTSLGTGTTSTGNALINFAKGTTTISSFGAAHLSSEYLFYLPALSDATNRFTVLCGFTNGPTTNGIDNNAVDIRYTDNVNGGRLHGVTRSNAGVETTVDLGVTVAANTLYKVRVEVNKTNTEARFYVNGVILGTSTTNMPNTLVCGARAEIAKSVGITGVSIRVCEMKATAIYN